MWCLYIDKIDGYIEEYRVIFIIGHIQRLHFVGYETQRIHGRLL